jgi:hypothetical protein
MIPEPDEQAPTSTAPARATRMAPEVGLTHRASTGRCGRDAVDPPFEPAAREGAVRLRRCVRTERNDITISS